MESNGNTDALNIDEISGDLIKKELQNVVEKQLRTTKYKMGIEHGSKKGRSIQNSFKSNFLHLFAENSRKLIQMLMIIETRQQFYGRNLSHSI